MRAISRKRRPPSRELSSTLRSKLHRRARRQARARRRAQRSILSAIRRPSHGAPPEAAIAEQFEENRLGALMSGAARRATGASRSRDRRSGVPIPQASGAVAAGQHKPGVVLRSRRLSSEEKRSPRKWRSPRLQQHRAGAGAGLSLCSFEPVPSDSLTAAGGARPAPRGLFPAPSGPTSINMRPAQFGQSSIAAIASRLDGAGRKSSRAKLGECGQRNVSCRGGDIIGSPAPRRLDKGGSPDKAR